MQAVIVVVFASVAVHRSLDRATVAVGLEGRAQYLSRCEPSFGPAALANATLGPDAHILSQDSRTFYFDARITREKIYRRATHYDCHLDGPSDLGRNLRAAGFTHLLLTENLADRGATFDPTLGRLADADDSIEQLAENVVEDADGGLRRYRLLKLP